MKEHYKTVHGWSPHQRFAANAKPIEPRSMRLWEHVYCQQFFRSTDWKQYFFVKPNNNYYYDAKAMLIEIKQMADKNISTQTESISQFRVDAGKVRFKYNKWLYMTGWVWHLA